MRIKIVFLLIGLSLSTFASSDPLDKYMLIAVYLEKFALFTTWPKNAPANISSDKFVITVIGDNPFETKLERLYSNHQILKKDVEIQYIGKPDEIKECHILFISSSMENQLSKIIAMTRDEPILTITMGDTEDYCKQGVLVNFFTDEGKIHFEINETAVKESGLFIKSLLMAYAKR